MTLARRQQISLAHTPYYHCTARCVRRAFLCGHDPYSGQNFDHRKQWLEDRLAQVTGVFAIDLLGYAIMSNHYHVVVRIRSDAAAAWSDEEVQRRWEALFRLPEHITPDLIHGWRQRLADLSWYMRCLNEPMARAANREDRCSGRFWEGRFRSQALLDLPALLKCLVYVDLNPIRAGLATTPERSSHTSVKARIEGRARHLARLPVAAQDYLALVDWSGRQLRAGKRGRIPSHLPPILERLNLSGRLWTAEIRHYGHRYYRAVGSLARLDQYCRYLGQRWLKGQRPLARAVA